MCYSVPLLASLILNGVKKARKTESPQLDRLNLLFLGGTIMLIVDHLWNREFFWVSGNVVKDLLLGVAMTAAVLVFWVLTLWGGRVKTRQI